MHHENVVASLHIEIRPVSMSKTSTSSLVQIIESEATEWKAYLVQELMHCSLSDLMERGAFTKGDFHYRMKMILLLLKDIALGMTYIHSQNVIHGDLKPENILIKRDKRKELGLVGKITDFGLCSTLGLKTHVSNFTGGTPFYMDPLIRANGQTSKPSDLYSFGVLMVEVYTNQQPWTQASDGSFMENKAFFESSLILPKEYAILAANCLQVDAKARPSFDHVVSTLNDLLLTMEKHRTPAAENSSVSVELQA